jgi:hypothetical protein
MVAGLTFTGEVDPTALATLVLAFTTVGSLLLTVRSLRYTKDALDQARDDVELARRQVEEAHRPVVVPIIDTTRKLRPDRSDSPTVGPQLMVNAAFWVPVENIGPGPALDVQISIEFPRSAAEPPTTGEVTATGAIAGLGADRLLPVEIHGYSMTGVTDFQVTIIYRDVAGKSWQTTAEYAAQHGRYERISISERSPRP